MENANRPFTWHNWDDSYNGPVSSAPELPDSSQRRTVMQVGLDWLLYLQSSSECRHLWLQGLEGRGKTHLASVLAVVWAAGYDVDAVFCNWSARLGEIRDSFNGYSGAQCLTVEQKAGILVLDDMGAERNTLWTLETLYRVLEARRGRPTIYTSNFSVKQYGARLCRSSRRNDDAVAVRMLGKKIGDRLSFGRGGYLQHELLLNSQQGSYRSLPRD